MEKKTVALWRFLSAVSIYVRVYTHRYLGFYKRRDIILWRTGGPPAPQYSRLSDISTVLQDSILLRAYRVEILKIQMIM